MKRLLQFGLIGWFSVVSLFVFVATYTVLKGDSTSTLALPPPPRPPAPPELAPGDSKDARADRLSVFTQQVTLFGHQTTAYTQYLVALQRCGVAMAASNSATTSAGVAATAPSPGSPPAASATIPSDTGDTSCGRGSSLSALYELAVTKTISPLLDRFLVALIALAFAKVSGTVVDNYVRARTGEPLEKVSWFD